MGTAATPPARAGGPRSSDRAAAPPPFPFLVGSGRAGTTLLRAMLDSHPEVAVPPETYFITELLPQVPRYEAGDGFATRAFLRDILENKWFRRWELPPRSVREAVLGDQPADYPEAIRCIYRLFAAAREKPRYGDKTPVYVYDLPSLARLFPEGRFVHVVRDGRDVAASFIGQRDMRPNGVAEAALLWRERVETGRAAGAGLGPSRYLEVRYEELVQRTEEVLVRLCDFTQLDYDDAMLTYTERSDELVARDGGPQRHRGLFMAPQAAGLRDWRTELAPEAVEVFEMIAGDLLTELGYERRTDTAWVDGHKSMALLVQEVERLRSEVVAGEREFRTEIRKLRRRLRATRGRGDPSPAPAS